MKCFACVVCGCKYKLPPKISPTKARDLLWQHIEREHPFEKSVAEQIKKSLQKKVEC